MKKTTKTLTTLLFTLLGTAAQADTFNWNGWHAGLALGSMHSNTEWKTTDYLSPNYTPLPAASNASADLTDDASLVDGFAGYTWTLAPQWLAGVEVHAGHSNNKSTQYVIPGVFESFPTTAGYSAIQAETSWNDSLRGRIGYLLTPDVQLYALAGVAMADISIRVACPQDTNVCNPGFPAAGSKSSDRAFGYVAGLGAEMALTNKLTGRVEYTYSDFGTVSFDGLPAIPNRTFGFNGDVNLTTQAVTAGVAYHF